MFIRVSDNCGHEEMKHGALGLPAAACGTVNLSGCVACLRIGELNVDRCEFSRLAGATERCVAAELFELFHRRSSADLEWCPDRTGRHAIDANPLWSELLGHRLGEVHS